jgi:hypothetical protein
MGKDLYLEIILTPGEASRGGLFPVTVPVIESCPRCQKTAFLEVLLHREAQDKRCAFS